MATQSFLKAVTLRGEKEAKEFVKAVERSENFEVQLTAGYERQIAKDMDREMIRVIFCEGDRGRRQGTVPRLL